MGTGAEVAVVMAITAGYTAYQGYQANKAAKKSSKQMGALAAESREIQQEQWQRYKKLYRPLEESVINEANLDQQNLYGKTTGASIATGKALNEGASSSMVGENAFTSGVDSMVGTMALSQAEGIQSGNRQHELDQFNRKGDALNLGKHIPQQTSAMLQQTAQTSFGIQEQQLQSAQAYGRAVLGVPAMGINAYSKGKLMGDSYQNRG